MAHKLNNFVGKIGEGTRNLDWLLFRVLMGGLIAHLSWLVGLNIRELATMNFSTFFIVFLLARHNQYISLIRNAAAEKARKEMEEASL